MKPILRSLLFAACLLASAHSWSHAQEWVTAKVQVRFSPRGGGEQYVCQEIDKAKTQIRMQAYSFTSAPIAIALVRAKGRGVDIQITVDRRASQTRYSMSSKCSQAGIPIYLDGSHAIAHEKLIVIDGLTCLCGSYNWSRQADQANWEDLLTIESRELAAIFLANWELHKAHSVRMR